MDAWHDSDCGGYPWRDGCVRDVTPHGYSIFGVMVLASVIISAIVAVAAIAEVWG